VPYLIEEAYEVIEVIEDGQFSELREELGDLMVQVVFHAQIAREREDFDVNDVILHVVEKLIRRHPHVFGEQKDLNPEQVRDQWEKIKTESGEKKSVLGGLPKSMPALTQAFRVGEKAGGVGFDWERPEDVLEKLEEEIAELRAELPGDGPEARARLTDEIGDLLFAASSLARKLDIDPEVALRQALGKFRDRFSRLEARVNGGDRKFGDYTLDELEAIWQQVKHTGDRPSGSQK
jgi:MazG family protein